MRKALTPAGLTPKREAFAQAIVAGATQADAYRQAYRADKMMPATIHARASELAANGMVTGRIAALREELAAKALWTREQAVEVLRQVIRSPDNSAATIAAVRELNAMHGFNAPIKVDLNNEDFAAIAETVRRKLGLIDGTPGRVIEHEAAHPEPPADLAPADKPDREATLAAFNAGMAARESAPSIAGVPRQGIMTEAQKRAAFPPMPGMPVRR